MTPDAGIVRIHAQRMLAATPHLTALNRCTLPTPTSAPATACVVDTGSPSCVASRTAPAAPVSAQNPVRGF